ncbi:hypothetical protein [Phenylobacterium ferrooxidans]|uniref:Uncharacterized protein n=1 Tax=Phenylobacterium ferrooxidans TaxID=2982689 RepID=A0ABW6CK88_9CAUL
MRFEPKPLWTRDHERLIRAWEQLHQAQAERGQADGWDLGGWLLRKFGVATTRRLTAAQARQARRCLHAWRAGIMGLAEWRRHPRQERRNMRRIAARRAATAYNTAGVRGADYADAIRGTALEGLGRLMPSESAR